MWTQEDSDVFYGKAAHDLTDFCIATDKNYDPQWFHEEIASALMKIERREIKRLIIEMPPRHGKSEMATIKFPAWYLGRHPDHEIITASYSSDLARKFGAQCRDLMSEPAYKLTFPQVILKQDTQAKDFWQTREGGGYMAVGVGGPATGSGANLFLIDDPTKNAEEADSEVYREKVWDWYTHVARTRLEKDGVIVIICTRWHSDDLVGRILERETGGGEKWHRVTFPAIAENIEKYRDPGDALWPAKYNEKALADTRYEIGERAWFCTPSETPIVMADSTQKRISEVKPGDEIMGFIHGNSKVNRTKVVKSKVLHVMNKRAVVNTLITKFGHKIRCTEDHRWFTGRREGAEAKGNYHGRKAYAPAKVGSHLSFYYSNLPERIDESRQRNLDYLAGIIDGEGHIGRHTCTIAQTEGKNSPVCRAIEDTLKALGYEFNLSSKARMESFRGKEKLNAYQVRNSRLLYRELLSFTRIAKRDQIIETFYGPNQGAKEVDKVVAIEQGIEEDVYALTTETGNYIAWGYESSNSLFQQTPIASETQIFRPEWMKREFEMKDLEQKTLNRFVTIDVADTDKEGSDYIGVSVVDWDQDNNWYLVFVKRYRLNILGLVDLVFNLWNEWKPQKIGVEKKSFEDQLKPLLDDQMEERQTFPVVSELEHKGRRKEARIIGALQGRFEKGKIWFRKGAKDDSEALKRELFDFPKGRYDDLADALAYIEQIGSRPFSNRKIEATGLQSEIDQYFRGKHKSSFHKI